MVITDHIGRVHLGVLQSLEKLYQWDNFIPYWVGCITVDGYFKKD